MLLLGRDKIAKKAVLILILTYFETNIFIEGISLKTLFIVLLVAISEEKSIYYI